MTDEEMSELAECIADACEAAMRQGVVPSPGGDCCPFGALIYPFHPMGRHPYAYMVERFAPGVDKRTANDFIRGFDGKRWLGGDDRRAFALGRLFREQYK